MQNFQKNFGANTAKNNQLNANGQKHPVLAGMALGANSMMNPGSNIGQMRGGASGRGAGVNVGPSPAMRPPIPMPPPLPMGPMGPPPGQQMAPMAAPPMQPPMQPPMGDIIQPPSQGIGGMSPFRAPRGNADPRFRF